MPTTGRSQRGPGRAPPGGSCRRRSRFSRFRGAHDRGAYATACLRVPAGPPSQPKVSEAGGESAGGERGAQNPPHSSRLMARWGFGGVRWRVPPWRGCARVAPVPGCPVPFYPHPDSAAAILGWETGSGETGSCGDSGWGRRLSPLPGQGCARRSRWHRGSWHRTGIPVPAGMGR